MRKRSVASIIIFISLILVAATTASAQSAHRFEIDIPFQFILGGRTLPAGRYSVQRLDPAKPHVLMLKNTSRGSSRVVITQRVESENPKVDSSLVFHRRGDKFYLFQIWSTGEMHGNQIPLSEGNQRSLRSDDVTLVKLRAKS